MYRMLPETNVPISPSILYEWMDRIRKRKRASSAHF
jgi:hypothetical protein